MAGMKVIPIKCDHKGNLDMEDLEKKARDNKDKLASIMVTYPSTFGVFEEGIRRVCDIVHENGGQVYMDGANMNAQVRALEVRWESDCRLGCVIRGIWVRMFVISIFTRRTMPISVCSDCRFCIPHGGGGPGVGPIGVYVHVTDLANSRKSHLAPYLPGHPIKDPFLHATSKSIEPQAAAPFGSASILLISYAYIKMMGTQFHIRF